MKIAIISDIHGNMPALVESPDFSGIFVYSRLKITIFPISHILYYAILLI